MQNQPHVESWYAASANQQLDFPPLQGETATDVCVIGGGYTGLSTAIHLRQLGYSVTVLEANRVGWGAMAATWVPASAPSRNNWRSGWAWNSPGRAHRHYGG
jgi:glycine/D-amino acid oxidase-like deaminating enzyme